VNEGVLVLGADYRGLGVVQSLGRIGIPAVVLHERPRGLANYSRYVSQAIRWPAGDEASQTAFLIDLAAREGLHHWMLVPTRDDTAAMCARNAADLRSAFRVSVPPWEVLRWAYDKRLSHQLAADIGVEFAHTWEPARDQFNSLECEYPVIIKPAVKSSVNALTIAKAWRVDEPESLRKRLDEASALMPVDELLVQELIPGNGKNQLSFAALASEGQPIATMVAQRTRQYPMDFGRASTFVETVDEPAIEELGSRLIKAMDYTGLIEIEFKRDPRTNVLKLLDMNARVWGWHTLGRRAGTDFSVLLWRLLHGDTPAPVKARVGVSWMWPAADIPTAAREIFGRRLRLREYVRNFRRRTDYATLVLDDPMPGLLEVPLLLADALQRRRHHARTVPEADGASSFQARE
jgi:D-aspartate ligase